MAIFQKSIKYRASYITTLARLFDYSTIVYKDKWVSKMPDSDQVYTYGAFREKCYEISQLLCRYGIGGGDKVAIVSQNMPPAGAGQRGAGHGIIWTSTWRS